ncbi:MAG: MoaD/ThiS family protein [Phycisphaerales bacterium]|nr:MoaD/ThiS family protein [Phycisphaerales bacterium]
MHVEVLMFGPVGDLTCASSLTQTLADGACIDALATELVERFPKLADRLPSVRFAVNRTFVERTHQLCDGDEVALIPPVSGG